MVSGSRALCQSHQNPPHAILKGNGTVFPRLFLFGEAISLVSHVKHLGVIIDSDLEWQTHLENRTDKATRALQIFYAVCDSGIHHFYFIHLNF